MTSETALFRFTRGSKGIRRRYYVSKRVKFGDDTNKSGWRIKATQIEAILGRIVLEHLRVCQQSSQTLAGSLGELDGEISGAESVLGNDLLPPKRALFQKWISRAQLTGTKITVEFHPSAKSLLIPKTDQSLGQVVEKPIRSSAVGRTEVDSNGRAKMAEPDWNLSGNCQGAPMVRRPCTR